MKRILYSLALALAPWFAPRVHAWTYQDGDVLLVFRQSGFNNVEFDLGSVNQFLNRPDGYSASVTNFDLNLVTSVFGSDLSGVSVVLLATTSPASTNRTAWVSSSGTDQTANDVTPSTWQSQFYAVINAIGAKPALYLPANSTPSYSFAPTFIASYDAIVSAGGVNAASLPNLGGAAPFKVEQSVPGTFQFWGIQPSAVNPKPAAAVVGTFTIDNKGTLKFTVGSPPPRIISITRAGGVNTVSFTSTAGGSYHLRYSGALGAAVKNWTLGAASTTGTGGTVSLQDAQSSPDGFYVVQRDP